MLLHSLECSDDAGIAAVKKDISTMEAALKKLSQQEEKYTAELNDALQQYADLRTQGSTCVLQWSALWLTVCSLLTEISTIT